MSGAFLPKEIHTNNGAASITEPLMMKIPMTVEV